MGVNCRMNQEELYFSIALHLIPNVGPVTSKSLVSYCGSAEAVFKETKANLMKIPGIGNEIAECVLQKRNFKRVEKELIKIKELDIQVFRYNQPEYPQRLNLNHDAPFLLFYKGTANLNEGRFIAIVGTRQCTPYGTAFTEQLVEDLLPYECTIVSGLAFGIDITAHKAALNKGLHTIGVVAHGLDIVYPAAHRSTFEQMKTGGAILSEFLTGTIPDKENFPSRNKVVAGMTDAIVVVETAEKGGAMITAEMAYNYKRNVFALPGRIHDAKSLGCLQLIRNKKAQAIMSTDDIVESLGWKPKKKKQGVQLSLALDLSSQELELLNLMDSAEKWHIDELTWKLNYSSAQLSVMLLELEMKGLVIGLPGKLYQKRN